MRVHTEDDRPAKLRPVLVTDGGNGQNRSALSTVRALGRSGYEVHVTTTQWPSVAGWSRFCTRRLDVPPVQDDGYADAVRSLSAQHGYAAVFPASDAALLALHWSGCALVDKAEVAARSICAGFPPVPEQVFDDGRELIVSAQELKYPVVVKPVTRRRTDDPTVWRADEPADLAPALNASGALVVQEHLSAPMRAVAGVIWGGRLRAVAHQTYVRTWPRDCGVASAAVTTTPDLGVEQRLPVLLAGYDGVFQVQLLGEHVIDVNPRVYGSMPLSIRAGINLPDIVCRLTRGETIGGDEPLRARAGTSYRWFEGDLKHLRAAVAAGDLSWQRAMATAAPHPGTAYGDVALTDPAPSAARLVHMARTRSRSR